MQKIKVNCPGCGNSHNFELFETNDVAEILKTTGHAIRDYYRNHNIGVKMGRDLVFTEDDIKRIEIIRTARWSKKGE